MKRVLVLTSTFPRYNGDSTPGFVFELANRLAKNHKTVVLAPGAKGAKNEETMARLKVYRFQYFMPKLLQKVAYGTGIIPNVKKSILAKLQIPFFLFSEYWVAANLVREYNPELIHAHWILPQGVIAAVLKSVYKVPFIVSIHGSDLFPLKNKLFRFFQESVLDSCEFCTVNSTATRDELIKRFPHFKSKVKVIPMGVDTKKFVHKNVKSKFSEYKNSKVILFAGRLNEQKGAEYLIKSLPLVKNKIKNAKLIIIGDGSLRNHLENVTDSNDLKNDVKFIGSVSHDKLVDYYNIADVFVLPSITHKMGTEGQGLVLLEAMSCKTFVIGSDSGGIKTIIKNRENGLLVKEKSEKDLSDKITLALNDKKLRDKISKNSVQFVKKNYSWDIVSKKFEKIYKSIK